MTKPKSTVNRRVVLASRPSGTPTADNFRLEQAKIPALGNGQVLLRTLYLSLDPYMRGRMNATAGYAESVELDAVMVGGTVARVEQSRNKHFKEGDVVSAFSGWQEYAVSDGSDITKLDPRITKPSYAL
ncbi:MAG: NADP-dependent oxidoreductase, partial [Pseudomonadales bacterium]